MSNRLLNKDKCRPAFTLIELIITLGIVVIVMSVAYSMLSYGNNSFKKGTSKSEIQSNLRLASDYITKELRYASSVSLTNDDDDSSKIETNEYIYVDTTGMLKHYANGVTTNIARVSDGGSGQPLTLLAPAGTNIINFQLNGISGKETYNLNSSIYLLNQNSGTSTISTTSPTAISYTAGQPFSLDVNTNKVKTISVIAPYDVNPNSTVPLTVTVTPASASNAVKWEVTPPTIGTVDSSNMLHVSASAPYLTDFKIKAISTDNPLISVEKNFRTTNTNAETVPVTGITLGSDYDFVFNNSGILQMKAAVTPDTATIKTVTWSIDLASASIATIDSNGKLTATTTNNASAEILVTATTPSYTATKAITVSHMMINNGIAINTSANTLLLNCNIDTEGNLASEANGIKTDSIKWTLAGEKNGTSITSTSSNTANLTIPNSSQTFRVTVTATSMQGVNMSSTIYVTS